MSILASRAINLKPYLKDSSNTEHLQVKKLKNVCVLFFTFLSLVIFGKDVIAAEAMGFDYYSQAYINKFTNCTPYSENRTITDEGKRVKIVYKIMGWQNGKCNHFSQMDFLDTGFSMQATCASTKEQHAKALNSMKTGTTYTIEPNEGTMKFFVDGKWISIESFAKLIMMNLSKF